MLAWAEMLPGASLGSPLRHHAVGFGMRLPCACCARVVSRVPWESTTVILLLGAQVGIPEPPIMELSVRGAKNSFSNNSANSGDTEMALDMQVRLWGFFRGHLSSAGS